MKLFKYLTLATLMSSWSMGQSEPVEQVELKTADGVFQIPATLLKRKEVPHFYGTTIVNTVVLTDETVNYNVSLKFLSLQGKAKKFSVKVNQNLKDIMIDSPAVKHWAVRVDAKTRQHYLDIFPHDAKAKTCDLMLSYKVERKELEPKVSLLSFGPEGKTSAGFSETLQLEYAAGIDVKVTQMDGFLPIEDERELHLRFVTHSGGNLAIDAVSSSMNRKPMSLRDLKVRAEIQANGKSALVTLTGNLVANLKKGGEIQLFSGRVALLNYPDDEDLQMNHTQSGGQHFYSLAAKKKGVYQVNLQFIAKVEEVSGWKRLSFGVQEGAVVPVEFSRLNLAIAGGGLGVVDFDATKNVVPDVNFPKVSFDGLSYVGYLPSNGQCDVAWKAKGTNVKSELFFTSNSYVDNRVGGGLIYQSNYLTTRVLQGKLSKVVLSKSGDGDVVSVSGKHVAHWIVNANDQVVITLTGAYKSVDPIVISTQHPLGTFPAKINPIQLTPMRSERHTGFVRVWNSGSVNITTNQLEGMMQVTPEQFPLARKGEKFHQVFVYRFPAKQRSWKAEAKQILPEVSVRHLLIYGVGPSDRSLTAEINLDVSEAPLREWEVRIPDGYAVSSVAGTVVSDYVLSNQVVDGMRSLKVLFNKAVIGRHLISIKIETNRAAAEESWTLPHLDYPGVEDVRGQIGVASALGWRVTTEKLDELTEIPLAYFQKKSAKIQQAYRQRKAKWGASVKIEKLSQSVQADVFHLYTVRESVIECGVFINYFVVGAPVSTWRVFVPDEAENVTVIGQNVRSHTREGNHLIVTLEQPALGNVSLFVKYEQSIKAEGGALKLGQVTPLGVQSESGYVQVISPMQVKHEVLKSSKGLLALEEAELPAEYRVLSTVPTVAAWQYSARPFELDFNIQWFTPSDHVSQSIDYAEVETQLTKHGDVKNIATFFVKSRGKKMLRMQLPDGAEYWGAKADGKVINARRDGVYFLLPLPAQDDLNTPVKVELSYGMKVAEKGRVSLGTPIFSSPSVVTNWTVKSLDGELIVPVGGNVNVEQPDRGETGFTWLTKNLNWLFAVLLPLIAGVLLLSGKKAKMWKTIVGSFWVISAGAVALFVMSGVSYSVYEHQTSIEVVAPMVEANKAIVMEIEQISAAQSMLSPLGAIIAGVGILLLVVGMLIAKFRAYRVPALGLLALSVGLLMQYGGAVLFMGLMIVVALGFLIWKLKHNIPRLRAPAAAMVALMLMFGADRADAGVDTITEDWKIEKERLNAIAVMTWNAKLGEKVVVLRSPATLSKFTSLGCRVAKEQTKGLVYWYAVAEYSGKHEIQIEYQMPMPNLAENAWGMVTAPSTVRQMVVRVDKKDWETHSTSAVKATHKHEAGESVSELTLLPEQVKLDIKPKKINPDTVAVKFFAEVTDLYLPAPGVLDGLHNVRVNLISGRIRTLKLDMPAGLMVGDVNGAEIDHWSFDPKKNSLSIQLKRPMDHSFIFTLTTQRALKALPAKLSVEPIRVQGAAKVIGMLGLGFGNDAQPDGLKVTGMNVANVEDFPTVVNKRARTLRAGYTLHKAYRYGADEASAGFTVQAVSPELRVATNQNLYIGDERLVLNTTAQVVVTRAGIFDLRFALPKGFEVESVNGSAIRDFSEVVEKGKRFLKIDLNGKQLGTLVLKIALTSNQAKIEGQWDAPQMLLEGAVRQSGSLTVMPQQGIQVSAVSRKHVTQEDAREIRKQHAGALVFRMLEKGSVLKIAVEKLLPWVKAEMLQEVTLRDSQTRTRVGLNYNVSHAAVKELWVKIQGLDAEEEDTVRVNGAHVKGIEKVEGDLWKVELRRGMIGAFGFDLEFQTSAERADGKESIVPVSLDKVKQVKHYVSVRANERFDVQAMNRVKGWRDTDWKAIPSGLHHVTNSGVPALSYKLLDAVAAMPVQIKRHAMADTLKLRVKRGELETLFSTEGNALNHLFLHVDVVEKSPMRVTLPAGAKLFGVLVNGDSVAVVEEGSGKIRFNVTPGVGSSQAVTVQVVYSNTSAGFSGAKLTLVAPQLEIPMEQIQWKVILPKGVKLVKAGGDFEENSIAGHFGGFSSADYQTAIQSSKKSQQSRAATMMQQVDGYIKSGERQKANEILSQVARNKAVGRDMNNDAHDLLAKNQWQNALMGLNTRRQRMYLENKAEGNVQDNRALEEAASRNPLFKGDYRYDPNQVRDFMQGMSEDEKQSLEQIARLMVSADSQGVNAPQAIEVTMPEMGTVLEFERKIQLGKSGDLKLELTLAEEGQGGNASMIMMILLLAVSSALLFWKR